MSRSEETITMARTRVLVEVTADDHREGFAAFAEAASSPDSARRQLDRALGAVAGLGVELSESAGPIPLFGGPPGAADPAVPRSLRAFAGPETAADLAATSLVVPAEVEESRLEELRGRDGVLGVWPNSPQHLLRGAEPDLLRGTEGRIPAPARAPSAVDCRPFREAVEIEAIREALGVGALWEAGFRGEDVIVGIIDEGIDGDTYPVAGGFAPEGGSRQPGTAPVTSHGSMCAADVLVAAPDARLYDYPFLGVPDSGGALAMFQAVLDQRRRDGTPHLTTNSYGFVGVPDRRTNPRHEIHDIDHPLHRKVREVVASGVACFFAAGNCGEQCASGACHPSGTGPGRSIHASNSLAEVITVAAVNSRSERVGYSSQGPGMFEREKPDLATFTHFFANFGPDRPGGTDEAPYDSGTSAAAPLAAGAAALLLCAAPDLSPDDLRRILLSGVKPAGEAEWDPGYGRGVLDVAASYAAMTEED
ncbi:S8 family serine peptidase [Streptomyces alkaliphilus]|uniref:S8 family serine peptidase n=1 Tax=Streptomyces alkaliphilus TaxID=1472722 RepID=UPI00117CBFFE|nr:S8 family serine peptidase [Streptomyces alkaliphilus]MQS09728.1 S8 family serine peptidase [Streptomyces alkaliphilus]